MAGFPSIETAEENLDAPPRTLPLLKESTELLAGGTLSLSSLLGSAIPEGSSKEGQRAGVTLLREGIPPIATRLVEKIRSWQYVDLANILTDMAGKSEDPVPQAVEGQILLVQSLDQVKKKKRKISDSASWAQAFAVYVAAMASSESVTKEELTGMLAHQHVILQIQKDLGGTKWLQYDQQYREWAAATKKRLWGEMNLTIYGRCLCAPSSLSTSPSRNAPAAMQGKKGAKRTRGKNKACFRHNFEGACSRTEADCHFDHVCWHCGSADHIAGECPRGPKRQRDNSRKN